MNNYDSSSMGDNIEFSVFYDNDLARHFYDDFTRENTRLTFGRYHSLFLIGDCEAPYFKKSELLAKSKNELFELCSKYELISYSLSLNDYKKSEYIDELLSFTIKRHYEWLTSEYTWHGINENITHDYYISSGYSQGDSVYIVSLDKPIDKAVRQGIDNVLWDSPIAIIASINGFEFYECDFIDDYYEWDIEHIKEKINGFKISDYAKQWLIDNLPQYPAH